MVDVRSKELSILPCTNSDRMPSYTSNTAVCLGAANHNYGGGNPMRPHRVRLTHSLVENYNLNQRMLVHRPEARSKEQIENFHCDGTPLCQVLNSHCRFPGPARMLELQSIQLTLPSHHCNPTSLTLHSHSAAFTLEAAQGVLHNGRALLQVSFQPAGTLWQRSCWPLADLGSLSVKSSEMRPNVSVWYCRVCGLPEQRNARQSG